MPENKRIENEKKMIKFLNGGATLSQLKEKMNYNDYQLSLKLASLENKGYLIKRGYHGNKVIFFIGNDLQSTEDNLSIRMDQPFDCLVISDTHMGSSNENLTALKSLYQYAKKKGIHHVFHLGDFIEGISTKTEAQRRLNQFENIIDNVDYAIKNYPKIDKINTTMLLGNHDQSSIVEDGLDIRRMIMKKRADINIIGYKSAVIRLLDKKIVLEHPFLRQSVEQHNEQCFKQYEGQKIDFIFRGHLHRSNILQCGDTHVIHVPCLKGKNTDIGAWYCTFINENDFINKVILSPLVIFPNNQVMKATKFFINYEEKEKQEKESSDFSELSQIEKFEKRYEKRKR